jgi:hypothetical protein
MRIVYYVYSYYWRLLLRRLLFRKTHLVAIQLKLMTIVFRYEFCNYLVKERDNVEHKYKECHKHNDRDK